MNDYRRRLQQIADENGLVLEFGGKHFVLRNANGKFVAGASISPSNPDGALFEVRRDVRRRLRGAA